MIVSIHMPKAAGTSFAEALRVQFGERVFFDYGDGAEFNTPEIVARMAARIALQRAHRNRILREFDAIHGHFIADKYTKLFPETHFITFFCDPYQQALSDYAYLSNFSRNYPSTRHHVVEMFRQAKMSFSEYLAWDVLKNPQSRLLGGLALDELVVTGLREEFPRSIALVNRRLSLALLAAAHLNAGGA